MKKEEKKRILILILISVLILAIIWIFTKNTSKKAGALADQTSTTGENKTQQAVEEYNGPLTENNDDGTVKNISPILSQERKLDNYKISNIKLTKGANNVTRFSADVTNKSEQAQGSVKFDLVLLDKKGNELGRIPGVIIETKSGETIEIRSEINQDYVSAYDFKIVKK